MSSTPPIANESLASRAGGLRNALALFSLPALIAQAVWGLNTVALKYTVGQLDPYITGFLRAALAGLLLVVILHRREGSLGVPRHLWPRLVLVGVVGMGFNMMLWQIGLSRTSATNAVLLTNASPIFALALAVGIGQEKLVRRRVAGMLVALLGAGLVVGTDGFRLTSESSVGNLMALGAVFCWAAYNVFGVPLLRSISPLRVTTWAMLIAAATMLVFSPLGVRQWDVSHVDAIAWSGVIYGVVLGTVCGTTLWSRALQTIGATATMVYSYLSPILAIGFAALLLGERIQAIQILGATFVIAGVTLSQGRRIRAG
jgi:drug/metabolite transporter (DMT)-like permease